MKTLSKTKQIAKLTNKELQDKLVRLNQWISGALLCEPELPKMEKEYSLAMEEMERRVASWKPSQIFASVVIAQESKGVK